MRRAPIIGDPSYLERRGWVDALRRLRTAWRRAWTPRVPPDPVEWVEGGGVVLPSSVAARGIGGRLSFRARPYWRLPLRWFAQEGVETIVVEVASQCGKTTLDIALALYAAEWLAGPGLVLMPSEEHAEDLVRDRLRPIFQASPFGKGLKSNDLRLGGVSFPGGGNLNVIGVGSPNALKGRPARWVLFDEYDEAIRYGASAGSPLKRAETRTRTYGSLRRIVLTSTPTVEDKGIHPEYDASRRHEWHVPCPHCGAFQKLDLDRVKWPRNAEGDSSASPAEIKSQKLAWYECASCEGQWSDADRLRAIAAGRVHCLDPDRPTLSMGLHISVLYSPDVSLSETAAAFLDALEDPEKLKQFRNEWLAEPRREIVRTTSTDQAHLATLQLPDYQMPAPDWWQGEETPRAPDWVRAVTWGFDVQGSEVWGLARGWGDHGENCILWCGSFRGAGDLDHAAQAYCREWIVAGGEVVRPRAGMMDSGYRTHEVYRVCSLHRARGLTPSKGRLDGTLPMSMSAVDRQDANRRAVGRVDLAVLWTTYWQDLVAATLEAGPGRGRGVCHMPGNPPSYLFRHLTAERKVAVKGRNNQITYVWKAHSHENHLRDCMVYSHAAAGMVRLLELRAIRPVVAAPEPVEPAQEIAKATAPVATPGRPLSGMARLVAARKAQGSTAVQMRRI